VAGRNKQVRATGKGAARGERFARLTQSLLESEAVSTLPPTAFKLLTLIALGARPPGLDQRKDKGSNGVQAVTDSYSRRFGFNSRDTVYRGLDTLLERGLIIKTRDGWRSKTHFALYAVAWLPVTHRDGEPLDTPEPVNDSWRDWKPATAKLKKKMPSDSRTQSRPMIGHDDAICPPTMSRDEPLSRPIVGNTLRPLGVTTAAGRTLEEVPVQGSGPDSASKSPSKTRAVDLAKANARHA
jgi:hypothetical protein